MFKSLSLEINAYIGFVTIKVWAKENELHYSKDIMVDPDISVKDKVSSVTVETFVKKLDALRVTEWKKNYAPYNEVFMDGLTWEVKYEDSERKKIRISGDNAYPANWKSFIRLLKDIVGDFDSYED